MMRALIPARMRKAVRTWFDARYISAAVHRQDIKDALWEVQTLRREVIALQHEVAGLRAQLAPWPGRDHADQMRFSSGRS